MLSAFGLSDPGCQRGNNEDYFLIAPPLGLYVVADGMGGAQAGEHASELAAQTVAEYIQRAGAANAEVLSRAVEEANRRVMSAAFADVSLEGMGTTLTAALEIGSQLEIVSVGDSRAYVYHDEQLELITDDQTWVNEVGRKLGITETALRSHPMRHVLTMAIGVSGALRMNQYSVPLDGDVQVLLCSDGLHGVIGSEIIAQALSFRQSFEAKCHYLIEEARKAGGPDNITAVLIGSAPS